MDPLNLQYLVFVFQQSDRVFQLLTLCCVPQSLIMNLSSIIPLRVIVAIIQSLLRVSFPLVYELE